MVPLSEDLIQSVSSLGNSIKVRDYYLADYQYELLCKDINEFQNALDDDHEVGLQLASFGQSVLLNVTDIRLF